MPELPEVETIVRTYRERLEGRRIVHFASTWPKNTQPSAALVRRRIVGRRIERLWRRAKYIVFDLEDASHLLVHLRMSGRLEWAELVAARSVPRSNAYSPPAPDAPRHARAWWDLDDGHRLWFCDARKFGRIMHARGLAAVTAGLGAEPLDDEFTPDALSALLRSRRRQLKPLLLDQAVVAGLGNIYVDEALHAAGLHPLTPSDRLREGEIDRLHAAIRDVLTRAIAANGTSFDWIYPGGRMQEDLAVYGRAGERCRRCGERIEVLRVAQRGTHVCPRCQPPPARGRTRRRAGRTYA